MGPSGSERAELVHIGGNRNLHVHLPVTLTFFFLCPLSSDLGAVIRSMTSWTPMTFTVKIGSSCFQDCQVGGHGAEKEEY